jgi:predicted amidohydrolase
MQSPAAPLLIALVEMTSGIDPDQNLAAIDAALGAAAKAGAVMAFLPEMSLLLDRDRLRSGAVLARESDSPWPGALQILARRHGIWLHSGSMPLLADIGDHRVNRSHVIAADGSIRARYDKIHMFDVTLPSGENWSESAAYAGGDALVVVDSPIGRIGLSVCYDLRFPELYRALVDQGAEILVVPAAFTISTGEAHWHILLRARAIENGCFVLAAAQAGHHEDGRSTFGHSLAVDPWGSVIAEGIGDRVHADVGSGNIAGPGYRLILAPIDGDAVSRARQAIPLHRSRTIRRITL